MKLFCHKQRVIGSAFLDILYQNGDFTDLKVDPYLLLQNIA